MQAGMKAGFGQTDITPQVGIELCGFGWHLERKSTGIIEPIYANAFVWQLGERKGVIVSTDLLGVDKDITHRARLEIADSCQIPYDHILICATHSHSGPTTVGLIGWGERSAILGRSSRTDRQSREIGQRAAPGSDFRIWRSTGGRHRLQPRKPQQAQSGRLDRSNPEGIKSESQREHDRIF
ncbi:neutral/alkaline non-lysosomal ceramidase N-terminal domain-containing protein [Paenibacillus sp. P26]|nr:neutral/alkaline non-lysosomal ceramidase N-terminal domain-containing protein [Paenibacillus sp. P26]